MDCAVFLLGFMGAGKSTIGTGLADQLRLPFFDLDQEVVRHAGKDIPSIFSQDGEPVFRKLELETLRCLELPAVVALGGGAFMTPAVRAWIADHGLSVFLQWPFEVLLARIIGDTNRPLVADPNRLQQLYLSREPVYLQADLVWTSTRPEVEHPSAVIAALVQMLSPFSA